MPCAGTQQALLQRAEAVDFLAVIGDQCDFTFQCCLIGRCEGLLVGHFLQITDLV